MVWVCKNLNVVKTIEETESECILYCFPNKTQSLDKVKGDGR